MQIMTRGHYPRDTGDYTVTLNRGRGNPFAIITLDESGSLQLNMLSVDDCDRMLKAAAAAKALLIEHAGDKDKPHEYRAPAGKPCNICGRSEAEHVEYICTGCGVTYSAPPCTSSPHQCAPETAGRGEHPYPAQPVTEPLGDAEKCGERPYPAGSEGDDGTRCMLATGHDGPHDDSALVEMDKVTAYPAEDPGDCLEHADPGHCHAAAEYDGKWSDRLYCWRPDDHEGPHYDVVDGLAWTEVLSTEGSQL